MARALEQNGNGSGLTSMVAALPASILPAFALLDNVRSAWNVGSVFRTADAVGLAGLFLCGLTPTPPRPDIEKTALGASLTVPWDYWSDPVETVVCLQEAGIPVVALEQVPRAEPFETFDYPFPLCCVVGHERSGVSTAVLDRVDAAVEIPMLGHKDSLNVAVSFGVLAYTLRRARARSLAAEQTAADAFRDGEGPRR